MDTILLILLLMNMRLLATSRLKSFVHWVAAQGLLLGVLAVVMHTGGNAVAAWGIALVAMLLKGFMFPWLMLRVLRDVNIKREMKPYVGPTASLLVGVVLLGLSFLVSVKLPMPVTVTSSLIVPVAFFSILSGLFLIVARKQAVTQVLGYLIMENGVYVFGVGLVMHSPLLVELAVLLDLFVAVFVMGLLIFRIQKDFDHIDTDRMVSLRD